MAFDRIVLLIGHDNRGTFHALDINIEDRVVTRFAADDPRDVFRVDADGDGIFECAVNNGGDQARYAGAACFVFAAACARLRRDYCFKSQLLYSLSCASPFRDRFRRAFRGVGCVGQKNRCRVYRIEFTSLANRYSTHQGQRCSYRCRKFRYCSKTSDGYSNARAIMAITTL